MERVRKISGNRISVGPGTLYAMLAKFEEKEIIRLTASEGRRKSYVITELGRAELKKEFDRLNRLVQDGRFYFL